MAEKVSQAQRLLGLVLALSNRELGLTKAEIDRLVPGYEGGSGEAAEKRFTRDKDELANLGFDVQVVKNHLLETVYKLATKGADLTASLNGEERMLLAAAANLWSDDNSSEVQIRLHSRFHDSPDTPTATLSGAKTVAALVRAITNAQPVRFNYRKTGSIAAETREIEPWYLFLESGNLYLRGFDRDRDDSRFFRVSRIDEDAPVVVLPQAFTHPVPEHTSVGLDQIEPILALRENSGRLLRLNSDPTKTPPALKDQGWEVVQGQAAPFSEWAERVLAEVEHAVVIQPASLRDFVDKRIDALADLSSDKGMEDHRG